VTKILWVGPGMGNVASAGPWPQVFGELRQNGLQIQLLELIDFMGVPKKVFTDAIPQITKQVDFFQITGEWDVILLDFIEAWYLGCEHGTSRPRYWPLPETPYKAILHAWERKLRALAPFQIWVRHDKIHKSTIIPELGPEYHLVVETEVTRSLQKDHFNYDTKIIIEPEAYWWTVEAVKPLEYLHVWQRCSKI